MNVTLGSVNPTAESEQGYGQLLQVLLRRRFWLLSGLVSALGIAAVMSLLQTPTYVSFMQLLVEPNYQGKAQGKQALENEYADSNIEIDSATQISLMQSTTLLQKAMALVNAEYPEIDPKVPNSVSRFKDAIEVQQVTQKTGKESTQTKIFQVTYHDNDPVRTQKVLIALQKVYLNYNLEQQKQRLVRGLSFVDKQLPQIRQKVEQSENALEKFRRDQGLIDPELQAKAQAEALLNIQQQQQNNLAQIQELRTRYANLQNQVAMSPQQALLASRLAQSTRYQSLLNEIQKTELTLEQQRLRFRETTPYVQQLQEQRQRQLGLLQTEMRRVVGQNFAASNNSPLTQGQLGELDVSLIGQMVDSQVALNAAQSRYLSLATAEQQLRAELKRFPNLLAEYGRLQPEVELSRETLKQLLQAQQEIGQEIARGGFDWQIVEEPQLGAMMNSGKSKNFLVGAVVGLLLGGVAAFAREAADDSVHSSDDLKRQVAVPLLGMVPALSIEEESNPILSLPFRKGGELSPAIAQVLHWQPFRESLDLLYQNLQLLGSASSLQSIVVTSALAGEGKSTIALGLAASAARLHQRVLLIDADLRRPSLHKLLNLPNDRGLSTLLTSDAPLPRLLDAHQSAERSNISILTSGPTSADPAKLLSSQRMRDVIAAFEQTYDLVLLDAPPILGMVDAVLAASCCSGVILVGRIGRVTRTELTQATTMLNKLNVIGVVANGAKSSIRADNPYQVQPS